MEDHLINRYGKPLLPKQYGEDTAEVLTNPRYASGVAFGVRSDTPIMALDV